MKTFIALFLLAACVSACANEITVSNVNLPATTEHGHLTIQYAETNRGQHDHVIICLHGFTDSWVSYELFMHEHINAHVVTMTHPCYGESTKDATVASDIDKMAHVVVEFMNAMNLARHGKKAIVIGHSMSSVLAARLAYLYPARFEGAVMMGAFTTMLTNPDLMGAWDSIRQDVNVNYAINPNGFFPYDYCYAWQTSTTNMELVPAWFLDLCTEAAMMVPGKCWNAGLDYITTVDIRAFLPDVQVPVLVLYGTGDFIAPSAATGGVESLFEGLPNMQLQKYNGLGHAPHWEAPEEVAIAVNAFIDYIHN